LHEDLLSVAVLAMLSGEEPRIAVRRYAAAEGGWRRMTAPIARELAA
jgi:hypothetical protein